MTDQTKEQTPDIQMIKKARAILDKTPEPHHDYAFFAGQEWVSKEAHKEELATQYRALCDAFEKICGEIDTLTRFRKLNKLKDMQ